MCDYCGFKNSDALIMVLIDISSYTKPGLCLVIYHNNNLFDIYFYMVHVICNPKKNLNFQFYYLIHFYLPTHCTLSNIT